MHSHRILKFINLSIAVLIVLLAAAILWFMWRPMPKTSGTIQAPVSRPARVVRDSLGVPHIEAATIEDALFLQGYVTAQDRLWQMDSIRRYAAGELSEVVGPAALELDRDSRRLRMRRVAREQTARLSPADRALIAAYARGVNCYIEQQRGNYPVEFTILGYDPRPWSVEDSILAALNMFRDLTTSWKDEIMKASLLQGGDRDKVDFLFPAWSGAEPRPGSNAWVIGGARTSTGKPILANDPHLGFTLPSTWYMVHLKAPGLNVRGATLPGLPAVIIGHNDRIAWGVTNLGFDVQDLYREQLDPRTGQYAFRGKLEQAIQDKEVIAIKGRPPLAVEQWVTRHGPVMQADNGQFYAIQWAAAQIGGFGFPFLEIDRARNWTEFTAALERFPGPGQNFVFADVDGNIGYHAAGKLPVRDKYAGDVPADGPSGEFEWNGYIPFDQLPWFYNPPAGLIVTANQNPFPRDYKYKVNGVFASQYRALQIRNLLSNRNGWKPGQILAVQKDVYSPFSHFLARQAVAAFDRKKPSGQALADATSVLRGWDGQMDKDQAAPLVAEHLYLQLRRRIADNASPQKGALYSQQMATSVTEQLLTRRPPGWFADYDQLILDSLAAAIEEGAKTQGSNVKGWKWGVYNQLTVAHPVLGQIPLVGKYFNIGPIWMSGSTTTVKQTTRRIGPSMRMVVDLSNLEGSFQNVTIGQSGHYFSRHYKDEWDSYYVGNSFPMQYGAVSQESVLEIQPGR